MSEDASQYGITRVKPRGRQGGRKPKFVEPQERKQVSMPPWAWAIIDQNASAAGIGRGEYLMRKAIPRELWRE